MPDPPSCPLWIPFDQSVAKDLMPDAQLLQEHSVQDLPHIFYRRMLLDGRRHVFHTHGTGRIIRNDDEVLIFDWRHHAPHLLTDIVRWNEEREQLNLFDPQAKRAYGRNFVWRTRPLNIAQIFDQYGQLVLTRIDFASPALHTAAGIYQTDLYLDCLIAANGTTFLIEDEDELADAHAAGLISDRSLAAIEAQCAEIVDWLRAGTWNDWLMAHMLQPFTNQHLDGQRNHDGYWHAAAEPYYWPEDE